MEQSREQRLLERLNAVDRDRGSANLRPRDAATLIVIDRSRKSSKFLMGRRNPSLRFMPGKFVFPGGSIDPQDRRMPAFGTLADRVEAALAARVVGPSRGRALAMAAIREAYEETGLLLGTRAHGPPEGVVDGPWAAFRDHGVLPALEEMHFIARAITPPRRPRRFDTRFFAVDRDAIALEVGGTVGPDKELVETAWVTLKEARGLDLPHITQAIVDELDHRIQSGFAHDLPVPFYVVRHGRFVRDVL